MDKQHKKITILNEILKHKTVLFGKFSPTLTHEDKINCWKEITTEFNSNGIFTKDWKYLRDTVWQNWRKRTVEKRDNRRVTGSGGGKICIYDEGDELVLKIIGQDSPVLEGLNTLEPSGTDSIDPSQPIRAEVPEEEFQGQFENSQDNTPTLPPRKRKRYESLSTPSYEELKLKKIQTDILLNEERLEVVKRERYRLDLELMKLEKELSIKSPSTFTLPYYLQDESIIHVQVVQEERKETQLLS